MSEGNTNIFWWREENKKNSAKFQTKMQFQDRFRSMRYSWVKNHALKVSYVLTEWCWFCSPSRFSPSLGGGWMYNGLSEEGMRMEGQQLWLAVNDVLYIRRAELAFPWPPRSASQMSHKSPLFPLLSQWLAMDRIHCETLYPDLVTLGHILPLSSNQPMWTVWAPFNL